MKRAFLGFLIFLVFSISWATDEPRGLTSIILDDGNNAIGGSAAIGVPAKNADKKEQAKVTVDREEWNLIDSVNVDTYLKAGSFMGVEYYAATNTLTPVGVNGELNFAAMQALQKAPAWLRADLKFTLSQLNDANQEIWANVINEAQHPYIDEIAFSIARCSANFLESEFAYPELFEDNAFLIYAHDADLDYVEVVDYGIPFTDDNYYSTTRYWKRSADGSLSQVEVPRDIYYMYLVHLKITDEIPAYIDPITAESNTTHQNNITGPSEGEFWREFLYEYNDPGYPLLKNYLMDCDVVWNGQNFEMNTVMGSLEHWINESMQFTSDAERPHQPVRIYKKHIGRCGEYADMRAALGRAALVPMTSVLTISGDHTWNEFWDEGWIHWDGGSINNPLLYENGWGRTYGSVFEIRSDGMFTPVTETYSEGCGTINVHVTDVNGDRVDGARVILGVMYDGTLKFDNHGYTDNEGIYSFTVGEGRDYYAKVYSEIGDITSYQALATAVLDGEVYDYTLQLTGTMPQVVYNEIDVPADDSDDYKLVVDFEVPDQVVTGAVILDDLNFSEFYNNLDGGTVNLVMTDFFNYNSYWPGYNYDAFNVIPDAGNGSAEFNMPVPDLDYWYAFFDNKYRLNNAQYVKGSFKLYAYNDGNLSGTINGNVSEYGTDNPISGAEVLAGAFSTTTDADGNYSLAVHPNSYHVLISADNYLGSLSDQVVVAIDGTVENSVQLLEAVYGVSSVTAEIQENGNYLVNWQEPEMRSLPDGRELMGYNVYIGSAGYETEYYLWSAVGINVAGSSFEDMTFAYFPEGIYRYAVRPIFSGDQLGGPEFSELVYKDMMVTVGINVSTNSGDSVEGATVSLVNQDCSNSIYSFSLNCDDSGDLNFENVLKGIYDLKIELPHFNTYLLEDLEITENTNLSAELIEVIYEVYGVSIIEYMLYWNPVPADLAERGFMGYKVYVDDMDSEIATVTEANFDLSSYGDGEHTVGVSAQFDSGISPLAQLVYTAGSSLGTELLAYLPMNNSLEDISGNGYNGEAVGDITFGDPFIDGCAMFDAEAEYVSIPGIFPEAPNKFSVSWWMNPASALNWNQQVRSPQGWNGFNFHTTAEHTIYTGTNTGTRFTPNTLSEGIVVDEWQQFVFTFDNGIARLFKNGNEIGSKVNMTMPVAFNGFWIGNDTPSTIDGMIDDFRIYARGLGDMEVQSLFTTGMPYWGTLTGTITNESGDPVANAIIQAGMFSATTDASGIYSMDVAGVTFQKVYINSGDFDIEVAEDVVVSDGETTTLDFVYHFTSEEPNLVVPKITQLNNNYPNPFNPTTTIGFNLKEEAKVKIEIYNIHGQKVDTVADGYYGAGYNNVNWNGVDGEGRPVASGVYFYKMKAGRYTSTKKMILMK